MVKFNSRELCETESRVFHAINKRERGEPNPNRRQVELLRRRFSVTLYHKYIHSNRARAYKCVLLLNNVAHRFDGILQSHTATSEQGRKPCWDMDAQKSAQHTRGATKEYNSYCNNSNNWHTEKIQQRRSKQM